MNKLFSKIKSNRFQNTLYKFALKNKYRRLSQPGLSRYSVDDLGIEHPDYFVKFHQLINN
jgi:hypothetical protein